MFVPEQNTATCSRSTAPEERWLMPLVRGWVSVVTRTSMTMNSGRLETEVSDTHTERVSRSPRNCHVTVFVDGFQGLICWS